MLKKVRFRSNEFVILIGDDIRERDEFTEKKFFNGVRNAFQKREGIPDPDILSDWAKKMLLPIDREEYHGKRKYEV
jgi:hypothetical protein